MKVFRTIALTVAASIAAVAAYPCSRVVYLGENNSTILVGRTLDWRTPIPTNLYVYPGGIAKTSMPSGPRLEWTSKYGSVLAVGYDGGVTEGINEHGLAMNGLFCKMSEYRNPVEGENVPVVSLAMMCSFFLDNFTTVDEVSQWLDTNAFAISGEAFDGGTVSLLHWALTDAGGNTMVMEYDHGVLKTYQSRDLTVLTNDPQLPDMEAIENYWKAKGGSHTLPGTASSPDRFVRASYFINHVPKNQSYEAALGSLRSIMGTVSVPFGYSVQGEPNISSTQWTSISDITGRKYYMYFADSTGMMWIDMSRLRFNPGAPILKLDTSSHSDLTGCVNDRLEKSPGFTPMW